MAKPDLRRFLGTWQLDTRSCEYEQGDVPKMAVYEISMRGDAVQFQISWVDTEDQAHGIEFGGLPDGQTVPFQGGELADAMSVTLVSDRELNSAAYWNGREVMLAQRQLDETAQAMRVTQIVRFVDGNTLANVGVYLKRVLN